MQITVQGKPKGKGRPRVTRTGHCYTPKTTREYETRIKDAFLTQIGKVEPEAGPLSVTVCAFFKPPSATRKADRERMVAYHDPHTKKPDIDNIVKCVDALNGLAWQDDSQIAELTATKCYSDEECLIIAWEPIQRGGK